MLHIAAVFFTMQNPRFLHDRAAWAGEVFPPPIRVGGTVSLYYDGEKVGAGRVERTVAFLFSADETTDVGRDTGTPVTTDYDLKSSIFTGTVNRVQIDTGKDSHDHLIKPEDFLHVAITRQ
jgi:arylsulfatase